MPLAVPLPMALSSIDSFSDRMIIEVADTPTLAMADALDIHIQQSRMMTARYLTRLL